MHERNKDRFTLADFGRMVGVAFCLSAAFWLADSTLDAVILKQGSLGRVVLHPETPELVMRLLGTVFISAVAWLAQLAVILRRRQTRALFESEERLRKSFEESSIGMDVVSLDGRILDVNPAFCAMLGYSEQELIGMADSDISVSEDMAENIDLRNKAISGEISSFQMEKRYLRKDGRIVWVLLSVSLARNPKGQAAYFLAQMQDITESKRAERALAQSEETLRTISASANDGIVMIDHHGRISFWNPGAERLFGYAQSEAVGMDAHQVLTSADYRTAYQNGFSHFVKTGHGPVVGKTVELLAARNDGTDFPIELSVSAVLLEEGWNSIGIIRDITERRSTEEALRESAELFRGSFEEAAIGMDLVALDGTMLKVNRAFAQMLGYSEDELVGRSIHDITFPEDMAPNLELRDQLFRGEISRFQMEKRYVHKEGHLIWALLSVSLVRDAEGEPAYVVGQMQDITHSKHAEEALRESEERFRSSFEHAAVGMVLTGMDDTILKVNAAYSRMLGYDPDDLLGANIDQVTHPDDRQPNQDPRSRLLDGEIPSFTMEKRYVRKDGGTVWALLTVSAVRDANEQALYMVGQIQDITEQKAAREALKESEEKFRKIFDSSPFGIGITDPQRQYVDGNRAMLDMLGYSIEELRSMKIDDITVPDDMRENETFFRQAVEGNLDTYALHKRYVRKDGSTIWGRVVAAVLRDAEGEVDLMIGMTEDVTDRKRARELSDALNDINVAISSTLDLDEIMRNVLYQSCQVLGAEKGAVHLRDRDEWVVRYVAGSPSGYVGSRLSAEEAPVAGMAAENRRPVVINDAANDLRFEQGFLERYGIKSYMCVPLITRENVIGTISFSYHSAAVPFKAHDIDFANKLAVNVALAMENARLYAAERHIADTLQEAVLAIPATIPDIDFGHLYRSATEAARIGGDFYDLFELEDDQLGILVGDVSGKGIDAAALTALVKNTVKAYAYQERSPAAVVAKTNELIIKTSAPAIFVTLFFAVLDKRTGTLAFCNAGHPPVILKKAGGALTYLSNTSPAIGAFANLDYVDARESLQPGDVMIMYTDGVTEARRGDSFFGEERLINAIRKLGNDRSQVLAEQIFQDVLRFSNNELKDDLAILALSLKGGLQGRPDAGAGEALPAPTVQPVSTTQVRPVP